MARDSPRARISANWWRIIVVNSPRRRCVGDTVTAVTAATGTTAPPGSTT
ncbi:Uncharacterised protein [Mycobacteroides abscessus subsp. abscessus]|nr:Uncharacterised protein [Mycobacteroides abscessus subsp. abscessus]